MRVLDVVEGRVIYEDPLDPSDAWIYGVETRVEALDGRCSMSVEDFDRLMIELSYKPAYWESASDGATDQIEES